MRNVEWPPPKWARGDVRRAADGSLSRLPLTMRDPGSIPRSNGTWIAFSPTWPECLLHPTLRGCEVRGSRENPKARRYGEATEDPYSSRLPSRLRVFA